MAKHPEKKPDKSRTSRRRGAFIRRVPDDTKYSGGAAIHSPPVQPTLTEDPARRKAKVNDRLTTVWTVGHSTRRVNDFVALLQVHGIQQLVDVRTVPRSRHNPQFNQDQLPESLKQAGIQYIHMPALGGLRHALRNSINTAWQNAGFRGFADYMQTPEFDAGLKKLIRVAAGRRTAIMCAEAVPWRCHRSLIADALLVHGIQVEDVVSGKSARRHTLTPWASVAGERITYPPRS